MCLIGLVVQVSASGVADLWFDSWFLRWDFSGLSHTGVLKIDAAVVTLPDAWGCRISTGTGWPWDWFGLVLVYCGGGR